MAAECVKTTTRVAIVIMDSSGHNARSVMNPCLYSNIYEFAEANKLKHMDISPGDQIIANESERICIQVNNPGTASVDVDDSFFRLTCKRIRPSLF